MMSMGRASELASASSIDSLIKDGLKGKDNPNKRECSICEHSLSFEKGDQIMILRSTELKRTASFNGQSWRVGDRASFYEGGRLIADGKIIRILESFEGCYAVVKDSQTEEKTITRIC